MKKQFFVGLLAGLLLASAFPAYGAVSSLVGMKVQAENYVIVNGNILGVKAINIDGTTYSPNRAIADALGLDVKFENQKVYFESKTKASEGTQTSGTQGGDSLGMSVEEQISDLEVKKWSVMEELNLLVGTKGIPNLTEEDKDKVSELNATMEEYQKQIDALKAQIEAEQAPAQ